MSNFGFVQQMIHSVFPLLFICTESHITVVELCKILPQAIFVPLKVEHLSDLVDPLVSISFNRDLEKRSFFFYHPATFVFQKHNKPLFTSMS